MGMYRNNRLCRLGRIIRVLALASLPPCAALAEPVSADTAGRAARAWSARGRTLGARLGRSVDRVATHATTNGTAFYAVRMADGGTVFVSGDTGIAPIVGFTAEAYDYSALDPKSPLWALLNADLSARGAQLGKASPLVLGTASASSVRTRNERRWADLLAEEAATPALSLSTAAITAESEIDDVRVPPLVKSKWSQETSRGKACWNYYTPNGSDPSKFSAGSTANEVCGCVATSMSQVMRYHRYPTASVTSVTRTCGWGVSSSEEAALELTTQGGTYDWDRMTLDPDNTSGMTAANYQAIGKLTSDAGITVYMTYHSGGTRGSGAYSFDIAYALTKVWGYGSAVHFYGLDTDQTVGSAERLAAFEKALFCNFDAGYPVCMGVPGHSIVADGYGFSDGCDYVHLNMGWAGSCDYWYNLPDATAAHSAFTSVNSITYNVFPDKGIDQCVISGRVVDWDGNAAAGATVQVWSGSALMEEAVTTSTGVWGAVVPAGTYELRVTSADGRGVGSRSGVTVAKPKTTSYNWNSLGRKVPTVFDAANLGNSWGNDVVLEKVSEEASVAGIVVNGPTSVYAGTKVTYVCAVRYSDGTLKPASAVTWSIANNTTTTGWWIFKETTTHASLSSAGVLSAESEKTRISVTASCSAGGKTHSASLELDVVTSSAAPANDLFARATALSGAEGSRSVDVRQATDEQGEPLLKYVPSAVATVWWRWTAPVTGRVGFDTRGSGFDTVLGVYRGTTLDGLATVVENNDAEDGVGASAVAFDCQAGESYCVAVGGWCGTRGQAVLNWRILKKGLIFVVK